jgi:hypothetical protein
MEASRRRPNIWRVVSSSAGPRRPDDHATDEARRGSKTHAREVPRALAVFREGSSGIATYILRRCGVVKQVYTIPGTLQNQNPQTGRPPDNAGGRARIT